MSVNLKLPFQSYRVAGHTQMSMGMSQALRIVYLPVRWNTQRASESAAGRPIGWANRQLNPLPSVTKLRADGRGGVCRMLENPGIDSLPAFSLRTDGESGYSFRQWTHAGSGVYVSMLYSGSVLAQFSDGVITCRRSRSFQIVQSVNV